MLPCSSSAQMEGCEEERGAHMQTECNRLTEERDEAERQLKHIKRVSQMVIEEVTVLQTQLEIEKSCRENAEALATKLNCENRKLKYLSLTSRPCLDELLPSISDCIALETDADAETDAADSSPDNFTQYQQQVKELRETVNSLLEEKKNFVCQIHDQQRQIEEMTAQSEKDQAEMKELRETAEQQSKTIKRFNRVSMMATQEYDGMKEQLDLEQSLRVKAETYAHEMLVKQKEANRQSMLLLQSTEPSIQLLKALEDIATITKTLEEERLQHQQKRQLELLEEEKKEVDGRLEQAEKKNEELENTGVCVGACVCVCVCVCDIDQLDHIQKQKHPQTRPGAPEAPGDPGKGRHDNQPGNPSTTSAWCGPAACSSPTATSSASSSSPTPSSPSSFQMQPPQQFNLLNYYSCNISLNHVILSLSSLIAIMRKSSKGSKASLKAEQPPAADDVKVKAVNEMMERIKHGVVLRPVKSQENKPFSPPVCEEKPQESAMDELKGILETVKRSPSRGSQEAAPSPPGKKDSELEVILRRRRNKAGEAAGSGDEKEGQMSHVSSSDSLNGRRTSSDSGKDPEGLSVPSEPAGPRVSPERRGSGPGPIVARRKSSDTSKEPRVGSWQERRSCSSLSEKETVESPISNGCVNSVGEDDQTVTEKRVRSNGVDHTEPGEDARATICAGPENGGTDAEC
ncbi:hypothetical protein PAMA_017713 [Pampus argenteus]